MTTLSWPRPADVAITPWRLPEVATSELPGSVRLWTCHLPGRELASLRLWLPLGASTGPEGLSALAVASLLEGAGGLTALQIAQRGERLGATLTTSIDTDGAALHLEVPRGRIAAALELLADLISWPELPDSGVQRRRTEQSARVRQAQADPSARAARLFETRVLGGYGVPADGRDPDVTRASVAAQLAGLDATASTLLITGDLGGLDLVGLATGTVGQWRTPAATGAHPKPVLPPARPGVVLSDRPGSVQSAVVLGRRAPSRHEPGHAIRALAATGVIGLFNGRLNFRLREERGYTYGAQGGLVSRRHAGLAYVPFTCRTDVTGPALRDAFDVLSAASAGGLTAAELAQARSRYLEAMPLSLETSEAIAGALQSLIALDLPATAYNTMIDEIAAVTPTEVDAAAAELLDPTGWTTVVVGDRAVIGDLADQPGPVELLDA